MLNFVGESRTVGSQDPTLYPSPRSTSFQEAELLSQGAPGAPVIAPECSTVVFRPSGTAELSEQSVRATTSEEFDDSKQNQDAEVSMQKVQSNRRCSLFFVVIIPSQR
jgi:hypothetical protein